MAKDHGSSVKNDKQYEGLRKKGMSKQRAGLDRQLLGIEEGRPKERQGQRKSRKSVSSPTSSGSASGRGSASASSSRR
jgi:hypothetical protein